jgi:hypothetical protein
MNIALVTARVARCVFLVAGLAKLADRGSAARERPGHAERTLQATSNTCRVCCQRD